MLHVETSHVESLILTLAVVKHEVDLSMTDETRSRRLSDPILSALSLSVVVSSWSSRLKQRRRLCRNTAPVLVAQLNGHNGKILQEMFLAKVGVTRDPTRPADVHLS